MILEVQIKGIIENPSSKYTKTLCIIVQKLKNQRPIKAFLTKKTFFEIFHRILIAFFTQRWYNVYELVCRIGHERR